MTSIVFLFATTGMIAVRWTTARRHPHGRREINESNGLNARALLGEVSLVRVIEQVVEIDTVILHNPIAIKGVVKCHRLEEF